MGVSEVVWGVTDQANGTACQIDFGDGSLTSNCAAGTGAGTVVDRSYIAVNHTYALSGTYTVTLTVGAESATTTVRVFDPTTLTATQVRGLDVNRAIEDGLRWLWFAQENRAANFPNGVMTNWGHLFTGYRQSFTALVVLAFENHGYHLTNNNNAPTGVYEKYIVQRGINYIADKLQVGTLTTQTAGDPCAGFAANCVGLFNNEQQGYSTALSALPLAGSGALNRTLPAGLGSSNGQFVAGKTIGDVLQRLVDAIAWGQNDGVGCVGRGGWTYGFSNNGCQTSDGSTVGWDLLALLDSAAGGVNPPAFVKSEFTGFAMPNALNTDGTFDYNTDGNPSSDVFPNLARAGIGLQALYYAGVPANDPRVTAGVNAISARWTGNVAGDYTATCGVGQNKGCAYGMFNAFKGLKLYGITSIPASTDWYAEYQDWLIANQSNPTTTTGGNWVGGSGKTQIQFSCCADDQTANAAIAELILAPVALIAPDPTKFSTVGLSPQTATNPVGTQHTVTATLESAGGARIPGATVTFQVLTGPNAGQNGSGTTNANGQTTFTYTSNGTVGTDEIQAYVGQLASNKVTKTWTSNRTVKGSGYIAPELAIYRASFEVNASGPSNPAGSVSFYYVRTRLNFSSTAIASMTVNGTVVTITGAGRVNGVAGYTFTAVVDTAAPQKFGIEIRNASNAVVYSAALQPMVGGTVNLQ